MEFAVLSFPSLVLQMLIKLLVNKRMGEAREESKAGFRKMKNFKWLLRNKVDKGKKY